MLIAESKLTDRQNWLNNRKKLEALRFNQLSEYEKEKGLVTWIDYLLPVASLGLKASGLYPIGKRNAQKIQLHEFELYFDQLPAAFDGYSILHLTDLHLDCLPGIEEAISNKLQDLHYHSCFITGDYRKRLMGDYDDKVLSPLRDIIACIQAEDGIFATLGNHDTHQVVEPLENMGVRVLTNESVQLERGQDSILVTGLDDPHFYFTHHAKTALNTKQDSFKIALVHSPEMYQEVADQNYALYLCGHTHAGQICLPGGIPLIKHLKKGKKLYKGLWNIGKMQGYTSPGCGVSGLPVRFNSQGEITLFTLRKKA
ncbi:putative MPP superfamily phosphohydrolase [Catalinimonas alkaloidigena]|uniref:metallophosphoesterase n=1 Tax=Catalinimonas alkaloidigena TaxID=1075417 RepID=UPI002405DEA9|nr:metallophosphoesterase [Catalinimonas alkaloidigena]MDF9795253.1 putative MPP superfamily phosphohydrolase [Catalinimonas alkaloidigena]